MSRLRSMSRYLKAGAQSQPPACMVAHLHGIFWFEVAGELQDQCTEVSSAAWISRAGGEKCPRPYLVRALVSSEQRAPPWPATFGVFPEGLKRWADTIPRRGLPCHLQSPVLKRAGAMLVFIPVVTTATISVSSNIPSCPCRPDVGATATDGASSQVLVWEHANLSTNNSCLSPDSILTQSLWLSRGRPWC